MNDNFAAFVLPLSLQHAVGIDWYHSGFDDHELAFVATIVPRSRC